jgi:hypothetical protein
MSQNFTEDVLVFDASDKRHRTTAAAANLDLYTEHTF